MFLFGPNAKQRRYQFHVLTAASSLINHNECGQDSLTAMCTYWAMGNRCAVYRPENTWCSPTAHHATAPHTITHTANRCHVQRHTTKYNIWDLNQPWIAAEFRETTYSKYEQDATMLSCMPHAGLMGVKKVKRSSWTQRQAETQPNVSHPLKSPPTRMLLHQHYVCVGGNMVE